MIFSKMLNQRAARVNKTLEQLKTERDELNERIRVAEIAEFGMSLIKKYIRSYIQSQFEHVTNVGIYGQALELRAVYSNYGTISIVGKKLVLQHSGVDIEVQLDQSIVAFKHTPKDTEEIAKGTEIFLTIYQFMRRLQSGLDDIEKFTKGLNKDVVFWTERQMYLETIGRSKLPKDVRRYIWNILISSK